VRRSEGWRRSALRPDEERHDDQRESRDEDAGHRMLWWLPGEQVATGLSRHVRCEDQETTADDAERPALRRLPRHLVVIRSEAPERSEAAHDLDGRVEAEADEGDAAGDESRDGAHATPVRIRDNVRS